MVVTTNFNIGDEVYFMHHNRVQSGTISRIQTNSRSTAHPNAAHNVILHNVVTTIELEVNNVYRPQREYFSTREELIKTL